MSVALLCIIAACNSSTPQQKAEKAVSNYLKQTLNDPTSYQPVKFDSLQNDSSSFFNTADYKRLNDSSKKYEGIYKAIKKDGEINDMSLSDQLETLKEARVYTQKSSAYIDTMLSLSKSFKREKIGYTIQHSYRAKNQMNALVLKNETFYLDTLFNIRHPQ